jgi:hypothetical protein
MAHVNVLAQLSERTGDFAPSSWPSDTYYTGDSA